MTAAPALDQPMLPQRQDLLPVPPYWPQSADRLNLSSRPGRTVPRSADRYRPESGHNRKISRPRAAPSSSTVKRANSGSRQHYTPKADRTLLTSRRTEVKGRAAFAPEDQNPRLAVPARNFRRRCAEPPGLNRYQPPLPVAFRKRPVGLVFPAARWLAARRRAAPGAEYFYLPD
jgi:hypothetical protein